MNRREATARARALRDIIIDRINAAGDDYPAEHVDDMRPDVQALDVTDAADNDPNGPWTWRVAVEVMPYRRWSGSDRGRVPQPGSAVRAGSPADASEHGPPRDPPST